MQDFINKLTSQIKNIFAKTTTLQKAILIGVLVIGLGAIIATIMLTSRRTGTLLFQNALTQEDARNVIAVLDANNIKYQYRNGFITLNNLNDKARAELELVKEGRMPTGVDGWELFDAPRIGITDVELDINKRRSLTKAITQLLTKLDFVQEATVDLAFPKKEYLTDIDSPVTASVVIRAQPFKEDVLRDPKTVRDVLAELQKYRQIKIVVCGKNSAYVLEKDGLVFYEQIHRYYHKLKRVKNFEEGIVKTIRWYLEHQDWVESIIGGEYMKYYERMYANR